jgi:steroid delta-isomerase-like uncharacterized protein
MTTLIRHLTAENAHDLEGTLATLHPDCLFYDHATQQRWHGHAGAEAHYRQHWASFDTTVERAEGQVSLWKDDDIYVAQAVWRGTHIGPFMDVAPTGKSFEHPFTVFVTFRDGLMHSEEFFYDLASLVEKLGGEGVAALHSLPYRNERG